MKRTRVVPESGATLEDAAAAGASSGSQTHDAAADDGSMLHDAQQALRESERRFRDLTELSSDWYWEQDEAFRFTFISNSPNSLIDTARLGVASHLGRQRWEMPALNLTDADWAQHRAMLERHEEFHDFVICRPRANGRPVWFSVSGRPIVDEHGVFKGYRGTGRDITAWREREEALLRFRAAVDATADGIHLVDAQAMRFIDVNETACRYLGYSREEFLALSITDVVPGVDLDKLARSYERLFNGEESEQCAEMEHCRRDGKRISIEIRRRGTVINGRRVVVNVVRDITVKKQAEATIRQHALQQSLIAGFGQRALASADLDELIARAVEVVREGLGVAYCKLMQLGVDNRTLVLKAGVGWSEGWIGRSFAGDGGTQNHYVIGACEPVIVDDFRTETRFRPSELLQAHGIRSGVDVLIAGASGTYGVLGAYALEQRSFSAQNVSFLQSLANTLATAMDRKRSEQRLTYLAQFDTLTGLPNRNLLLDRFAQALSQAHRNGWPAGALFIDLDRFKIVNDTLGHNIGDQLLMQVAQRLSECVRSADTVARLGGDEFACVLSRLARADDAALVAQKLVDALSLPFRLAGHALYVSASIGIAIYPGDGGDPHTLLKNADTAMYRAKERGRNTYQFYLPQMNARAVERMQLEAQLRGALERDEFLLHYQPKVSLASGEITGFEALLRWRHPQRGVLLPQHFIAILEDIGLINAVGEWVLQTVCEQLARWRAEGVTPRPVAVNLSARQFQQQGLDVVVAQALAASGVPPQLLELELTESMLMADSEAAVRMLNNLNAAGVRLSVDDFGAGYSSLAYLKRFPLHALKIDSAFIRDVTSDPDDAVIALAIINLAHSLELKVVAEGVENHAQFEFLRRHGCDELQGYYFSRPLSLADCTRALREGHGLQRPPVPPYSNA